jgi:hypothetical protein
MEFHAIIRQLVDVRRFTVFATVDPPRVAVHIISQQKNDIRFFRCGMRDEACLQS